MRISDFRPLSQWDRMNNIIEMMDKNNKERLLLPYKNIVKPAGKKSSSVIINTYKTVKKTHK